jgi:hypothetical protein
MELGWIVMMTLKLTEANIVRIKETLFQFANTNPLLSTAIFLIVSAIATALILKYKNPSQ